MYLKPSMVPSNYHEKMKILHAVNRPLEEITVTELCEACGISRKKFYACFESKYEVVYWYLDFCFSISLYEIGRTLTWHEGILACLQLVEQEQAFFLADYQAHVSKRKSYYWPLDLKRKEAMRETLETFKHVMVTSALSLEIDFYSQLVPDLIRRWLQPNEFCSVEEYSLVWEDSVPHALHDALELA